MLDGIILDSLTPVFSEISRKPGKGSKIEGVLLEKEDIFDKAVTTIRIRAARDANKHPYDLTNNSCLHFVQHVVKKAGFNLPWMFDPRPNSYIGELQDEFRDVTFKKGKLKIESVGD